MTPWAWVIAGVLWAGTVAVGLPLLFWSLEVVLGSLTRFRPEPNAAGGDGTPVRTAVLIPAHDEEAGLGRTLGALAPQLGPDDIVLVVADNCTDGTARVARDAGAIVSERQDTQRRGKGYALDHGLRALRDLPTPPDVVVIFDADCAFAGPGQLRALAAEAARADAPVQAAYTLEPPPEPRVGDLISAFAIAVKNVLRPLGLSRLGGPCLLTGTGMAVPFGRLASVALASGDLVEDMRLGVDLALAGAPPRLSRTAAVVSVLPSTDAGRASQRERWEQGHLRSIVAHVPRLLAGTPRRPRLALLAMELAVPPFSLLVMLACLWLPALLLGGSLLWAFAGVGAGGPLVGAFAVISLFASAAFLSAWLRVGQRYLPVSRLIAIPRWMLGKIGIYAGLARGGQTAWVRTDRGEG